MPQEKPFGYVVGEQFRNASIPGKFLWIAVGLLGLVGNALAKQTSGAGASSSTDVAQCDFPNTVTTYRCLDGVLTMTGSCEGDTCGFTSSQYRKYEELNRRCKTGTMPEQVHEKVEKVLTDKLDRVAKSVADCYDRTGDFSKCNMDAPEFSWLKEQGQNLFSIEVKDGVASVTLMDKGAFPDGNSLIFTPTIDTSNNMRFVCSGSAVEYFQDSQFCNFPPLALGVRQGFEIDPNEQVGAERVARNR